MFNNKREAFLWVLNLGAWWLQTKVIKVTDHWGRRSDGVW